MGVGWVGEIPVGRSCEFESRFSLSCPIPTTGMSALKIPTAAEKQGRGKRLQSGSTRDRHQ